MPESSVRVIVPDTGSAYGGKHTSDAAIEAARLARAAGRPVKVVWTREEEFTWAYFRPAGVIEIKSGISSDGSLTAWDFHNYHSGMSAIETPYVVANQRTEYHAVPLILRSGSYRGLAATANHFARETHMDALASVAKMDPFEFRMKNLSDPRMRVVSVAYFALVRPDLLPLVRPGGDASRVRWMPVTEALESDLAFDHDAILRTAVAHVTERLETTAISKSLVPDTFTIPELRAAFEIVSRKKLDRGNFRRKFNALVATGSMLGSGAVIVMDDRTCMVKATSVIVRFFEHESCGKCTPCREGTGWFSQIYHRMMKGEGREDDIDVLLAICGKMKGMCFCPLGEGALQPVMSSIKYFRDDYERCIRKQECDDRSCRAKAKT
jgi:ADP-ribose pyrophosphatase YjhB (NUDIX family)